jgi:RNA polymerase sigma-70 factor (ECF subfamily)
MNQKRFKQEVLPLRDQMMVYARRFFNDNEDAEDIVLELFLKLWYMRDKLFDYNNIEALSVTIVKNLSINKLKLLQRETGKPDELQMTNDIDMIREELEATVKDVSKQQEMMEKIIRNIPQENDFEQVKQVINTQYCELANSFPDEMTREKVKKILNVECN